MANTLETVLVTSIHKIWKVPELVLKGKIRQEEYTNALDDLYLQGYRKMLKCPEQATVRLFGELAPSRRWLAAAREATEEVMRELAADVIGSSALSKTLSKISGSMTNPGYLQVVEEIKLGGSNVVRKNKHIVEIKGDLLTQVLEFFPPHRKRQEVQVELDTRFGACYHVDTGALMTYSVGSIHPGESPMSKTPYLFVFHDVQIYFPSHGPESVSLSIVGDVAKGPLVVRDASACGPGFIHGSRLCNCPEQWTVAQELAARYNTFHYPQGLNHQERERLRFNAFDRTANRFPVIKQAGVGFILFYKDSQNGEDCGIREGIETNNIIPTANLRHAGEYVGEQIDGLSTDQSFISLGLVPDSRLLNNSTGFKVSTLILHLLNAEEKKIFLLTNNPNAVAAYQEMGFEVEPIQIIGRADEDNRAETDYRRENYGHIYSRNITTTLKEDVETVHAVLLQKLQVQ